MEDQNAVVNQEAAKALVSELRCGSDSERALFDTLFHELRRIARIKMGRERADHTLQATALVNEAFLKVSTENSLIDVAERPRHEVSQQTDPGWGMSVANNDAGAKDGEAGKTDFADGVFLHTHYADISKLAAGCASYRRKQAKLRDSGVVAAPRKCTDDAKFKSFQFFFGPACREPTPAQLTALTGPWLIISRARAAMRSAKSAVPISRTTLRTRDRGAMGFLVTITTSRHSGIASSSSTAAPPTCPVPPRIIAAKF
jgi:hypothetical protein